MIQSVFRRTPKTDQPLCWAHMQSCRKCFGPAHMCLENAGHPLAPGFISYNPLEIPEREQSNSADPDQMPQNAASDQVLHCLQKGQQFFFRNIYIINTYNRQWTLPICKVGEFIQSLMA